MKRVEQQNRISLIIRYLAIPHELLHVVGYRLVGKPCEYRWGDSHVKLLVSMTLKERLVGLLLPFAVFSIICLAAGILSGYAYRYGLYNGSFVWFVFLTGLALVSGAYAGTAIGDLRQAYLLILDKPWYSWTPFDIFFQPIVNWTEIRNRIASQESDDKQN